MQSYASATPVLALVLVSMLVALYLIYWFRMMEPPQDRKRCRAYGRAREWPEYFEEGEVPVDSPPNPDPAPAVTAVEGVATSPLQMQDAIDFSDMYVTEQNKTDAIQEGQDTQQIQSINDRFRAAKRNVVEFKMKTGCIPTNSAGSWWNPCCVARRVDAAFVLGARKTQISCAVTCDQRAPPNPLILFVRPRTTPILICIPVLWDPWLD